MPKPEMSELITGIFKMGDTFAEGNSDERPVHQVKVNAFFLSKYCVSFDDFDFYSSITGRSFADDANMGRGQMPVINVNWYEMIEYCNWLSEQDGYQKVYSIDKEQGDINNHSESDTFKWTVEADWSANGYRLPTEAEWEFAARDCGGHIRFGNGSQIARPSGMNFDGMEPSNPIAEVGKKRPAPVQVNAFESNKYGLFNMSGNVWEMCWDWYDSDYYAESPMNNPKGPESGTLKVARGGSWVHNAFKCRTMSREHKAAQLTDVRIGFRLARNA